MMTPQQVQELKKSLSLTAAYFQQQILDPVVVMYAQDLADLEFTDVMRALQEIRREKNRRHMPLPADIREKVNPTVSARSIADDVANRIIGSFRKHGNSWPTGYFTSHTPEGRYFEAVTSAGLKTFATFEEAAIAEIGEVGWVVLKRMGGYSAACREWENVEAVTTLRAQIRDLANSVLEQAKAGTLYQPPALPEPQERAKLGGKGIGALLTGPAPSKLSSEGDSGPKRVGDLIAKTMKDMPK